MVLVQGNGISDEDLREHCLAIYEETRRTKVIGDCRERGLGFEILMGAPKYKPPFAFIGYQPGPGITPEKARALGYENSWVDDDCHYATQSWALARTLRKMFPKDLLLQSIGLNAIFVGAKSIAQYAEKLPKSLREEVKAYCLRQLRRLLELMEPQKIILIGFDTLSLFEKGAPLVKSLTRKPPQDVLVRSCRVFDRPAVATLHLSGSRISNADLQLIAEACRKSV